MNKPQPNESDRCLAEDDHDDILAKLVFGTTARATSPSFDTAFDGKSGTKYSPTAHDEADYLKDELSQRVREEPGSFAWMLQTVSDGVFYWDLENPEHHYANPAIKALLGYADEEVPNRSRWWQENTFPEDREKALQALHNHIKRGDPYDIMMRYQHKDGSTVWVRCHGKAYFSALGKPIRMFGVHNDMTKLMKVQEELKKKESVLDLLCTTALDGYWDWNMKTNEDFLSIRWKNSLGYEEHEIENTAEAWMSLLHPDDVSVAMEAVRQHTDEGVPYSVVLRYKRKDGTVAHMLAQGIAQKDEHGEWARMFGTHTDVSYLEEARAAREANAAKTAFLATVSHEIRTPLNAVLGMAQILQTTQLTDDQQECVNTLHNAGEHLLNIINDIMDFSQLEGGMLSIVPKDIQIQSTVRDSLEGFRHSADKKEIALTFETQVPPSCKFTGDPDRIKQVCMNLVGNSVKFTSTGEVGVTLAPEERNADSGILISVTDTGCGVAFDQQECIFDDFMQANDEIRSMYGGSGLGLSISEKLTTAMGGSIEVKSEEGKGSVFSVWLPGLSGTAPLIPASHDPSVLLLDNPCISFDSDTLSRCIEATGRKVVRLLEFNSFGQHIEETIPPELVIVRLKDHETSESFKAFVRLVFVNSDAFIIDVGRHFDCLVPEQYSHRYRSVPFWPTTDELEAALSGRAEGEDSLLETTTLIRTEVKLDRPLRFLVAEDNLINVKVMKRFLSLFPCEVSFASNGAEAVEYAKLKNWDIIFMDFLMPVMDGPEATREIRKFDRTTPIVAVTANATTHHRDECYRAGMTDFLTKPVSLDSLRKIITSVAE